MNVQRPLNRVIGTLSVASLVAAACVLGAAAPASAATLSASTAAELESAIAAANTNPGVDIIDIMADITGADLLLDVTDALTIDVNGHTVGSVRLRATANLSLLGDGSWGAGLHESPDLSAAPGLGIGPHATLTITDLKVTAFGTACDSGIGGWNTSPDGECAAAGAVAGGGIRIFNSEIDAEGEDAPGIGSNYGHTSAILIYESVVRAFSDNQAGIGGGSPSGEPGGHSGAISIVSSEVRGWSTGRYSAAIGGGPNGDAGTITITGSTLTTIGGYAIGHGEGGSGGSLALSSSTLSYGSINVPTKIPAETTVKTTRDQPVIFEGGLENNGTIEAAGPLEALSSITNNGSIVLSDTLSGAEEITNNGTITPASQVRAHRVLVNNYTVTLHPNYPAAPGSISEKIYAPTFAAAGAALAAPAAPSTQKVLKGWNTAADGSGTVVDSTTSLAPLASNGAISVFAQWIDQVATLSPATATLEAGSTQAFVTTAISSGTGGSTVDVSASAALRSSQPSDTISGSSVTFTAAGPRTITTTYQGVTGTAEIEVTPGPLSELSLAAPETAVPQGGALTFTVDGVDVYGNPVEIDPDTVTLTSSVATDEIDGLTVTFPDASPHTITATIGEVSASVTIEVIPTLVPTPSPSPSAAPLAVTLPATGGSDASAGTGWALLLTLLGLGAVAFARVRTRRG